MIAYINNKLDLCVFVYLYWASPHSFPLFPSLSITSNCKDCKFCQYAKTDNNPEDHCINHNYDINLFRCPLCQFSGKSSTGFKIHVNARHKEANLDSFYFAYIIERCNSSLLVAVEMTSLMHLFAI